MVQILKHILESNSFTGILTALILVNAVTLGLETDPALQDRFGPALSIIDNVILSIFTLEIIAKLIVYRLNFFKNGWNLFDFSIVAISLIPSSGPLSILRAFRILRVLRIFSVVPQMRKVVNALFHALPGMGAVIGVLMIVFYVAAVLSTKLFGNAPNPDMQEWFGSIGASMYTLFQIMTLESWSMGIVRPTIALYPWAWAFFVPFIIVTSFAVLNLFIGIIVDAMRAPDVEAEEAHKQAANAQREDLSRRINEMQDQLRRMEAMISALGDKKDMTAKNENRRAA